ncbi:hypothetical protein [Gilvimarinus polysaccharolyticus]|uniref:hypothetical protein n=1 Tax=Gilvimarinus polysaccharolyticus TaxID=863921 RepID=UPI000673BCDE|nr:hypothetical protein [Gilvimarinus polysaccharolyticus]
MNKSILIFILFSLLSAGCSTSRYSVAKPEAFKLGENFEAIKKKALSECEKITQREIIPITAPLAKRSQMQIDCIGLLYAGKPRKVELVFQDDQLDLIWILIPIEEKDEVIESMSKLYGEPSMVIDYGAIYLNVNAAVRNEPTEVLFASKRQVEAMLKTLAKAE